MTARDWHIPLRDGLFPLLSTARLQRLAALLEADSDVLVQGMTTWPQVEVGCSMVCAAGCLVVVTHERFGAADDPLTVGEAEDWFEDICAAIDRRTAPMAANRLICAFDHMHRDTMRRELGAEIRAELARRGAAVRAKAPVTCGA